MKHLIKGTMAQAFGVLAALEHLLTLDCDAGKKDGPEDGIYLHAFSSCREQGFYLNTYPGERAVAFSENRNSEEIVVYTGMRDDFGINNVPTEEGSAGRTYFEFGEWHAAAQFILEYLIS